MSKHTPGPWRIGLPPLIWGLTIRTEQGLIVANATTGLDVPTRANARLIAAAPELLEALIKVTASLAWNAHGECRSIHDGPIMPSAEAVEFARAAIDKATGGQQ